ncbi:MSCRAMM family protein [Bifidobacterium thermophilum]|uniref:MSCRAMM family protein n=1 Tax=Bifidobacterium thermophilum TaxID=33905 RepID=UPI0030A74D1D
MSITFPDQKPVSVTYSAYLKGTGQISYSNKAQLYGQTSDVSQTTQLSNDSSSSASVPVIKILKNDSGNLDKPLSGAKFKLYRAKDNAPVTDREFTTGVDGIATITGREDTDGWSLFEGVKYYLVETQAPQGFTKRDDKIYFTVKDNPTGADEYPDSYTIPWSNAPRKTDTAFTIHKIDANTSADLQGAQFTLSGRRSTGEDITQVSTSTAGGMARFTGLKAGTYTLKESQAPNGYETPSTSHIIVVGTDLGVTYDGKPLSASGDGKPATVTIGNQRKRFFLPGTGHLGGMWLIMGAGGLVLGAGSVLMLADPCQSRHATSRRFRKGASMR